MAFRKTFNLSERAAFLALAELFRQGLVSSDVFDFKVVTAGQISITTKRTGPYLTRSIFFVNHENTTRVEVDTPQVNGSKQDPDHEDSVWNARWAVVSSGGSTRQYNRAIYPDHVYWSKGSI